MLLSTWNMIALKFIPSTESTNASSCAFSSSVESEGLVGKSTLKAEATKVERNSGSGASGKRKEQVITAYRILSFVLPDLQSPQHCLSVGPPQSQSSL